MPEFHVNSGSALCAESPSTFGVITTLLSRVNRGDRGAFDDLLPLVYRELHQLAVGYLRREIHNHTLQPTALIHEAYLRLAENGADYQSRKHFYAIAARVMRQVLVDHARARSTLKRGSAKTIALEAGCDYAPERDRILISLDDALKALAREDEHKARLVEMRFFGGMNAEEIADCLAVPVHAVRRELKSAQVWLRQEIEG